MSTNFNAFLPHQYVDLAGLIIAIVVGASVALLIVRWRPIVSTRRENSRAVVGQRSNSIAMRFVKYVLFQKPMADCSNTRWFAHFAMFWGFLGLAATTTLDEITNPTAAPLAITSPVRILGNATGILFVVGVSLSLLFRLQPYARKNAGRGDFLFLSLLLLAGLSGFATEVFSGLSLSVTVGVSYWFHIAIVASLLATAPFTKFIHSIGRPILFLTRVDPESTVEPERTL